MKCVGLDIGSTTIKGAILDTASGAVLAARSCPFPEPTRRLPPGWFEVDAGEIERAARQMVLHLLGLTPEAERLFISGQMGGVVLVDDQGGPLSNFISWRDRRSQYHYRDSSGSSARSYYGEIYSRWDDELLVSLGGELQLGSMSTLLFWLQTERLLPEHGIPASVADFVIAHWLRQPPQMHVTQAIGLLDLRAMTWHQAAFDQIDLTDILWPQLFAHEGPRGQCQMGDRKLALYGAYADQACALRGADVQLGELSINISTGSQVSCRTREFVPGEYQSRCYFGGEWLNTITHLPAGRSLICLVDLLTELARAQGVDLKDPWAYILTKAAEIPESDLEVELSFHGGPIAKSGSIHRITTENLTVGHLFSAAFRSMANNYFQCSQQLSPDQAWRSGVLSGGLSRISFLRRLISERFAVPLRQAPDEETLLGLLDIARNQPSTL